MIRRIEVEPSGVIFVAACQVKTAICTAREPSPVTAVWAPPGRTQINVCGACLEEMLRGGEWEIEGARLRASA